MYWPGCYMLQVGLRGTGLAAAAHRWYWPCCYSPQDSIGVLAWLQQAPGWPWGTGLAAAALRIAWGYSPGCYRLQVGLRGTGLAATALRIAFWYRPDCNRPQVDLGYWPGCCSPQDCIGVLAWLLEAPRWGTGLAAAALRIAWGYWPGCYRSQVSLWYWPGCYRPQVCLGVLAWLLQAPD